MAPWATAARSTWRAFFEQLAGVKMTHIPYRVTSQLQSDLISGEVPVSFQLMPNVLGALKAGQVRALAVANATRLPALPDVPTSTEVGLKGYESSAWFGLVAPRGTPRPIVDKLNAEVATAVTDPAVRTRFVEFGTEPLTMSPEEMGRYISAEVVKWRDIIINAGSSRSNDTWELSPSRNRVRLNWVFVRRVAVLEPTISESLAGKHPQCS